MSKEFDNQLLIDETYLRSQILEGFRKGWSAQKTHGDLCAIECEEYDWNDVPEEFGDADWHLNADLKLDKLERAIEGREQVSDDSDSDDSDCEDRKAVVRALHRNPKNPKFYEEDEESDSEDEDEEEYELGTDSESESEEEDRLTPLKTPPMVYPIPLTTVTKWYGRFMDGNFSLDENVVVSQRRTPFAEYAVKKALARNVDFQTLMVLRRVDRDFKRLSVTTPIRISKIKIIADMEDFNVEMFDKSVNNWLNFNYKKLSEGSIRTIGEKEYTMKWDFECTFGMDFIFIINQLTEPLEELDFAISDENDPEDEDKFPIYAFDAFANELQGKVATRKFTMTLDKRHYFYKKYTQVLMLLLDINYIETLEFRRQKFKKYGGMAARTCYRPSVAARRAKIPIRHLTRTEQWKAAQHLIWPKAPIENKQLLGFKSIEMNKINENLKELKNAFLQTPPEVKCVISLKTPLDLDNVAHHMNIVNGLPMDGTLRYPLEDRTRVLVMIIKEDQITVKTEKRQAWHEKYLL